MIISSITIRELALPLQTPFITSTTQLTHAKPLIVSFHSDNHIGWGEASVSFGPYYGHETTKSAAAFLRHTLAPLILKQQPQSLEDMDHLLRSIQGNPMSRAACDMAFHDLIGKQQQLSLTTLIGSTHTAIPMGISLGIYTDTNDLIQTVDTALAQGYQRVKCKISPDTAAATLSAVRRHYPDLDLHADANGSYTEKDLHHCTIFDEHNLTLIEQPYAAQDLLSSAQLQQNIDTAICLDESISSYADAQLAHHIKAGKNISLKAGRIGGIQEALRIHNYCLQQNIPLTCGGLYETGIGRAAQLALAGLAGYTRIGDIGPSDRYFPRDIISQSFTQQDGYLLAPNAPGLGVEIDMDFLYYATQHVENLAVDSAL